MSEQPKKILVIEDERDIADLIAFNLEQLGAEITICGTGEEGLEAIKHNQYDLLVLDLMLPDMDGRDICRSIKKSKETAKLPTIMVTARGEEQDVLTGFDLGVDDYISKPFSVSVLKARVQSVLRRATTDAWEGSKNISFGPIDIDISRHKASVSNTPLDLTATEFRILALLTSKPGLVYSRDKIIDEVHGRDYPVTLRSIDVQITGLRKKMGIGGDMIETVRGVGYKMQEQA